MGTTDMLRRTPVVAVAAVFFQASVLLWCVERFIGRWGIADFFAACRGVLYCFFFIGFDGSWRLAKLL